MGQEEMCPRQYQKLALAFSLALLLKAFPHCIPGNTREIPRYMSARAEGKEGVLRHL